VSTQQIHGAAVTAHFIRRIDDMVDDLDLTEHDIAAVLGTNVIALAKRCERGGRPDLARMFNQARKLPA